MNIRSCIIGLFLSAIIQPAMAVNPGEIRFHNENTDTTAINTILSELHQENDINAASIAKKFIGKPYVAGTLEGEPEMLTVNMDEFDCTTFAETVLALLMTAKENRESWRDFVFNLESLRYRNGEANGYASRLHYMSDWVVDNIHRGNIQDVTRLVANENYIVKTLDFMSRHATSYPALSDPETLQQIKEREIGFRNHRFPFIKKNSFGAARFKEGDFVLLTTKTPGLDVSHVGFITYVNGQPHLLHASSKEGKIVIDKLSLADYFHRNQSLTGVRVIRLQD